MHPATEVERGRTPYVAVLGARIVRPRQPRHNLDPGSRTAVADSLSSWGGTLIVVSHDDRWFHVADRVLTMRDGELKARSGG